VIDVATLSVIRRWALREQLSIREIARRSGLSRNTIKKYLASEVVEPRYAQRKCSSKLDPFADKLELWLKAEQTKNRKQRRTLRKRGLKALLTLEPRGDYSKSLSPSLTSSMNVSFDQAKPISLSRRFSSALKLSPSRRTVSAQ
jgi:transcriptional regulator with XRE-family HTH domain